MAGDIPVLAGIPQAHGMIVTSVICERFRAVVPDLDERPRCLLTAAEAKTAGYSDIATTSSVRHP